MDIEKTSNNRITLLRKLNRRKYRKKEGMFIAEGERCVEQILENSVIDLLELVIREDYHPSELMRNAGCRISILEHAVFDDLSDTDRPQGVMALCRIPAEPDFSRLIGKSGLILATDGVQDPGNLGTMIRTAVWFDATGLITGKGTVDPWHPKVVRSTAGATGMLPIMNADLNQLISQFEQENWRVLLLEGGKDSIPLQKIPKPDKTILVVGNEAEGIGRNLFKGGRVPVKIEGNPEQVESLNAAISVAIAMYEYFR